MVNVRNRSIAISIIVPIYKAESYLCKCLNSLLAQTFSNFEILLIDDGSPDRSGQICDEYALQDSRIHVFHKSNGGVASARQCGIEHAQGEYTIHVDPDDWVELNMLELLYEKAKSENADMVICDFYVENGGERIFVRQQPSDLKHEIVLRELFQHLHGSCCNKLIRRSCYQRYNVFFPLDLSYSEDLFVCCSLLLHDIKVAYLNKAFYHYIQNVNENSIVRTRDVSQDILLIHYLKKILPYDVYKDIALPKLSFVMSKYLFLQSTISTRKYRETIWPYKFVLLKCKTVSVIWRIILFVSTFGLKNFLFRIYIRLK